ncbi:3'-5' RNA exonuclease complex component, partial [Coemansia nantahalensis]
MQLRFCSKAVPPSLVATVLPRLPFGHRRPARRLLRSDQVRLGTGGAAPRAAASLEQLIDQLDALVKQPNPPRSYGDALVKEELRNIDYRDLTVDPKDKATEQGAPRMIRQRPKLVRHGQHLVSDSIASEYAAAGRAREAAVDEALDAAGMPKPDAEAGEPLAKDIALDLGITAEQRNRRRIWMARIAGYREFRTNLLSMDKLFRALGESRDAGEAAHAGDKSGVSGEDGASDTSKPAGAATDDSRASGKPTNFIRRADMPTHAELEKHVSESRGSDGQQHIPIVVYANVGDLVDIRTNSAGTTAAPFSTALELAAVVLRTTGRFQYSMLKKQGVIVGTRSKELGFVSEGLLFDKDFLRKGGVSAKDAKLILAYGEAVNKGALTNAADVERLQQVHNQRLAQPAAPSMLDNTKGDVMDAVATDVSSEESPLDFAALDDLGASSGGITEHELGATGHTAGADEPTESPVGTDELECILRVIPRALRSFQDNAERLLRSHYRELSGYWAMAIDQGQTSVTVDALAELIFGAGSDRYSHEAVRLAAYMHLSGNPLHFVPGEDSLFFTQVFELRPRSDVEEVQRAHDMVRRNAPEFKQFIDKARQLVAAAYERDAATPMRTGLSPSVELANDMFKCDLTGWDLSVEFADESWRDSAARRRLAEAAPPAPFGETDRLFIRMLRRFIDHTNFGYAYAHNPYTAFVAPIIKKIGPYSENDISTVSRFLVDIGVHPHWHNTRLNFRSLPFEPDAASSTGALSAAAELCAQRYAAGDPSVLDGGAGPKTADPPCPARPQVPWMPDPATRVSALTQSSTGVGIIDRTAFYGRDICEGIRHDFGDLPVYTIDDAATRDVDDGFSLETVRGADGAVQKWLHIHVADPTALIHPGHVVADAAFEKMTTLYLSERTTHMLPLGLTLKDFSLTRRDDGSPTRTMTFSARIGEDGDIVEYKVCAGLVRNITAVPYELADRYLSYEHAIEQVNSLAKLQDSLRHDTLVHPFGAGAGIESRLYGEGCGELPGPAVQLLREVQAILQRHVGFRARGGSFARVATGLEVSADMGSQQPDARAGSSCLVYPRITAANSFASFSPAHMMIAEAMGIACRVAARFASEHAAPDGYGQGVNSAGVATEWTTIPLLFRAQEQPDLPMLHGCSPNTRLAFDGMSAEDAQSAEKVWAAHTALAMANGGYLSMKHHDEVRRMMNPSVMVETPGVHTGMGVMDKYGYARTTSPIRRMDDLVNHWQIKAQLLAEHGDARVKQPWFWRHEDMRRLAPVVFRTHFAAAKAMRLSDLYWAITMVQRMEYEARRGILQQPPPGFYNPSSPSYEDNPFAHYDPRRPGPLVWTAIVDNRDESRLFISVILEGVGAQALLLPRPLDPMLLPFAGTRVRVHIVAADPARGLLFAKLAPLEFQPAET